MGKRPNTHVFLGGLHKSGTSILHRCLRDHPQVSGFAETGVHQDEGQLLQSVYPAASVHGGWGRFGFDPAAHLTESSATPAKRSQLDQAWGQYWDGSMPFLVEKSPPNLIHMRFLQGLYPDAYFVVILRHPIAVSLASLKWAKHPVRRVLKRRIMSRLVAHWVECHRIMRRDAPYIDRLKLIVYEDFVASPDSVLNDIYDFIGAPIYPRRLEIHGAGEEDKYLQQWHNMRSRLWYAPYAKATELRFDAAVGEFGYSMRRPELRHPFELSTHP